MFIKISPKGEGAIDGEYGYNKSLTNEFIKTLQL
jgi:hypothetical protein